jgi:dTDP-glucose pyrophosphorylase
MDFLYRMSIAHMVDGGIVTFESSNPHFSYVQTDMDGYVKLVAKNNPISNIATVGFYYWKYGSDFVKYAEQMIEKNTRLNGEFYIDLVYNEAINDGKKIITYKADRFWSLGTPEELDYFNENYRIKECSQSLKE